MTAPLGPNLAHVLGKLRRAPWMPTDTQPACAGNWWPYDELIDNPGAATTSRTVNDVIAICGSCPVQARCWIKEADEPWLRTVRQHRGRAKKRGAA